MNQETLLSEQKPPENKEDELRYMDNRLERCINISAILGVGSMSCDTQLANLTTFPKDVDAVQQVKQHIQHKIMSMKCQLNAFRVLEAVYQNNDFQQNTKQEEEFVGWLKTWFEMFSPTTSLGEFQSDAALACIFASGSQKRKACKALRLMAKPKTDENTTSNKKRKCVVVTIDTPNEETCNFRCSTPCSSSKPSPVQFGTPEECREAALRNM